RRPGLHQEGSGGSGDTWLAAEGGLGVRLPGRRPVGHAADNMGARGRAGPNSARRRSCAILAPLQRAGEGIPPVVISGDHYVGPDDIRRRTVGAPAGVGIAAAQDLLTWLAATVQRPNRKGLVPGRLTGSLELLNHVGNPQEGDCFSPTRRTG